MKKSNGKAPRGLRLYKSYKFRGQDPIVDALRGAVSSSDKRYKQLHEDSGVSTATVRNWFSGKTKRPQFATTAAVARALGKRGIMFTSNSGAPKLVD